MTKMLKLVKLVFIIFLLHRSSAEIIGVQPGVTSIRDNENIIMQ